MTQLSILLYAFSNRWGTNISRRVLIEAQRLLPSQHINFQPVFYHPAHFFRKYIEYHDYSLIIGLGDGSGNIDKIRIETQAKNSYNNQPIYPFSPILIDLNLPCLDNYDGDLFKISSNMGTYNCNWIAYRTQLYLNQRQLPTHHIFLHLPRRSNASILTQGISTLLRENHLLSYS